jgi:hypothetical protein
MSSALYSPLTVSARALSTGGRPSIRPRPRSRRRRGARNSGSSSTGRRGQSDGQARRGRRPGTRPPSRPRAAAQVVTTGALRSRLGQPGITVEGSGCRVIAVRHLPGAIHDRGCQRGRLLAGCDRLRGGRPPRRATASGSLLRTSIRQAAPRRRSSRRQRGRRGSPGAGRPPRICLVGLSGARPGSLSRRPVLHRARGLDGRHFQVLSAGPDAAPVQPLGRSAPRRRTSSCELDAVWVDEEVAVSHRGAPRRTHHRSSSEPKP